MEKIKILKIDACRNDGYWEWNNWYYYSAAITVEEFQGLKSNRATLKLLRDFGLLSDFSKGKVSVEDDGYNVVVQQKSTGRPILAIEYGRVLS